MTKVLCGGGLKLSVDPAASRTTVEAAESGEALLVLPSLACLLPRLEGEDSPVLQELAFQPSGLEAVFLAPQYEARVRVEARPGEIRLSSAAVAREPFEICGLSVLPPGTLANMYDVVNFRNRHYTASTWPELLLGGRGCETDTSSSDWQFAPHPSMMMLRKDPCILCIGAVELPGAFGLQLRASNFTIDRLELNYGPKGHGLALAQGEEFTPPSFCLFATEGKDPYQASRLYSERLAAAGAIPDPEARRRTAWHLSPVYCTWMDQGYLADTAPSDDLGEQQVMEGGPAVQALNEDVVKRTLDVIEGSGIPFGIYLLDDGWETARGEWEAHPADFPDLRRTVDEIHARGMKAAVWWNWAEVFDSAEVDPSFLCGGGEWRDRHGRRVFDFSNPRTRSEYLEPLLRRIFSSEPGCWDFDGYKSDFLADKVHPDMPLHDPSWRGEENYCFRMFELCDRLMRRHKPDGCHIGCAGHPHLAQFIDINRTYDVATSNPQEHAARARMLQALSIGCPTAFDFHNFIERFDEYFALAAEMGASVHIGNILGMRRDRLSAWEPAGEEYLDQIRRGLALQQAAP